MKVKFNFLDLIVKMKAISVMFINFPSYGMKNCNMALS